MSARRFRTDKKNGDKKSQIPEQIIESKKTRGRHKAPDSAVPEECPDAPSGAVEGSPQGKDTTIDENGGPAIPTREDETPIISEKDDDTKIKDSKRNVVKSGLGGGKFLTFAIADEKYGLEILKVREIIGMMGVTPIPKTPDFVRGVINLRGKVIPVVDLRLKLGMEGKEDSETTCIIVVQLAFAPQEMTMGVIVDEVSEVLNISTDQIEPPPSFGRSIETDFILGIGKVEQKVVTMLDIDRVLSEEEIGHVEGSAEKGT